MAVFVVFIMVGNDHFIDAGLTKSVAAHGKCYGEVAVFVLLIARRANKFVFESNH
jgi:hypothetical protein